MRIYVLVEDRGHLGYCYSGGCIPLLLKHGLSLAQGWPLSSDLLSSIGIKSGPPCLSVFHFFPTQVIRIKLRSSWLHVLMLALY